ncbi:MAG: ribosome silencing factor [Candidatus Coatesbacteria bacterium]|nr:ribosome silencing factor [Candidatus Coatesbacteria bacterium]
MEGPREDAETRRLLETIRECILERKGRDIAILDLTELTPIADYFVICSSTSTMHARAILEHVELTCKKAGFRRLGTEGEQNAKWILVDYGDVIVHIFLDETRQFYSLERLWGDAKRIDCETD